MQTRTERDPLGELAVPGRRVLRHPDGPRARQLPDQRPARAGRARHRHRPRQEGGRRRPTSRWAGSTARIGDAIVRAADEILGGALRDQFVVDVYQAGAGTSHNMNTNEVLANRAAELLGGTRGDYTLVHPNDHVNMGQSTNDVFPTATRLALLLAHGGLVEAARGAGGLARRARRARSTASSRSAARTCRTRCR